MDSKILNKIAGSTTEERIAFRKKAVIFSFFLFVSFIIWLITALSKTYDTTISYPVRYTDIPQDKVLIGNAPEHLTLRVSTHGYRILRHRLSSRYIPITFSVGSFSLSTLADNEGELHYIQTRFSRDHLARQLSADFEISEIKPDTLFFRFASIQTKKIPVIPDIIFEPDRQMILKTNPYCEPDSIEVTGPDFIMDTLRAVYTRQRKLGTVSQSFEGNIELVSPRHISLERERVKLFVLVERFTEKLIQVPVEVFNIPDTIVVKIFPSFVEVSAQVGLSRFPELTSQGFIITADYEAALTGSGRLDLNLIKSPDFVRAVKFSPQTVEFLIER